MAWVRCCGGTAKEVVSPITWLTGIGSASGSITIPNNAKYIITWNRQNNSNTPSITGCTYIGTKVCSEYDFSSVPSANLPINDSDNARIFKVNTSGNQTLTQNGSTQVGYLTSESY